MKKNKIMRLASFLLVAVMLSTCAISGTFAKYTTSNSGSDTARVAYWGFGTNTLTIDGLFSDTYLDGKVDSANTDNVIAPGTTGSATFQFVWTANSDTSIAAPETAYSITIDTSASECDNAIVANTNIQWKLDNGNYGTFAELLTAIAALNTEETYSAGELAPVAASTHTISWQWLDTDNTMDTTLGNVDGSPDVTVSISITATQVN